ncbi:MAG: hypothetical protein ACUVS2_12590 [Candidatus Flexifilum sp.]|jgi:ribosomal protein L37AE/L43A
MNTQQNCPKCGQPMYMDTANRLWRCRACLHRLPLPEETLEEAQARLAQERESQPVRIRYRGSLDRRARTVFENGHDALRLGDRAEAIRQFQIAASIQPDFVDAHYMLAQLSETEAQKRDHLSTVLAYDPGHLDALRDLMVLNGQLTPEEAARTHHSDDADVRVIDGETVRTTTIRCPQCGGDLMRDDLRGMTVCRFCGFEEPVRRRFAPDEARGMALGAALLKRKADPVRWVIGERTIRCTECGAEHTLPLGRMAQGCTFCGSKQIVVREAADTLYQPDGLVLFTIDDMAAKAIIRERLGRMDEKLAGLLEENRVARASIEPVYLPFWVFDVLLDVNVTMTRKEDSETRSRSRSAMQQALLPPYQHYRYHGGVNGVLVPAFRSPSADLIEVIDDFQISAMIPFEPGLLVGHPVELYAIDYEEASLVARSRAIERARIDYGQSDSSVYTTTVTAWPVQMSFIQVLLPVWIAALVERDGDVRPALVNGQTGRVALGRARKPR